MRRAVLSILIVATLVAAAAPQASAGPRTHLVRPGETLFRIALRYGVTVEALVRVNRLLDAARIRSGQRLTIPDVERSGTRQRPAPSRAAAGRGYAVQRGDTLASIARRHGITVVALMDLNGLLSDRIRAGQVLRLPALVPVPVALLAVPRSPFPVPAVSPGPEAGAEVIVSRPVRVRRGPRSYHTTLAIVAEGTLLRVLAVEGRWTQVQLPPGETGWLVSEDLHPGVPPAEVQPRTLHGTDIVREAMRYLGTPYVWGGESARGVDCSGFVYVVLSGRMPELARLRSMDYFQMGAPIDRPNLRPGDLVFFTTYAPGPSHVGIYFGDGRFIQASSGARRVVITPLDDPYYAARYLGARRLLAP